ncbi:MAG: ABC transporter permease [Pseudonocardia sp.]|uniref:ABC transporter permease n=1 Tax=unclassified Pseudonocardia TaxID=2619320 RepID=UPI00086B87A7|nr:MULTISPECIES: ABC transporter permease [unclassified Pseudonocardia]MBN9110678.1 ABC transporter permease [Pseudonocardia sp.]ODU23630.1 MAG: multidrug ABC transporter permease [Pseudonocardia sp. SCN 72-51]ODV04388.1 MAG: multidrug ABC transporter permease [Pseudonocardia sp. SCN 73-27]
MTTLVPHTLHLTGRHVRGFLRQPAFVIVTLVQPLIWLLLFGQLFRGIVVLPGFGAGSYLEFLAPGVVIMTVLFSSGWSGMAFIEDMDRGVMDRMLSSPASRGAMMASSVAYTGFTTIIQSLVIVLVAVASGARFAGGVVGVLVMLVAAVLLAAAFGSLSNGVALLVRQREALIGFSTTLTLPLSFLSSAIIAREAMPGWIQTVATWNPVDWAVTASRSALSADPDWTGIGWRLLGSALVALVLTALATRAFRAYHRSV